MADFIHSQSPNVVRAAAVIGYGVMGLYQPSLTDLIGPFHSGVIAVRIVGVYCDYDLQAFLNVFKRRFAPFAPVSPKRQKRAAGWRHFPAPGNATGSGLYVKLYNDSSLNRSHKFNDLFQLSFDY